MNKSWYEKMDNVAKKLNLKVGQYDNMGEMCFFIRVKNENELKKFIAKMITDCINNGESSVSQCKFIRVIMNYRTYDKRLNIETGCPLVIYWPSVTCEI